MHAKGKERSLQKLARLAEEGGAENREGRAIPWALGRWIFLWQGQKEFSSGDNISFRTANTILVMINSASGYFLVTNCRNFYTGKSEHLDQLAQAEEFVGLQFP